MSKEGSATVSLFFRELFQVGVYKRSQGRITRQVTFAVLALTLAIGAWRLSVFLKTMALPTEGALWGSSAGTFLRDYHTTWQYGIPMVLLALGLWIAFRVVNVPQFADFLIAVEAEMNKVSWPSRDVLIRSSLVVMLTIFLLAAVLFLYDLIWSWLLGLILHKGP
ncbi:MAG: preprotein translocase subunit SecE [Planctomycetaceae bacterium]|nr:preprotein translocase subunit SecE [Planctomycetaceae bacterium]